MFKRKLFKRALPIILSVAMVFQSMPATAMAAEDPAVVETGVENETTTDEVQPEADTPADGEEQPVETPDTAPGTEGSDESAPESTASPETSGESAPDAATDAENVDASVSGTDTESTEISASESEQEETTAEEMQEAAEAAALDTVINIKSALESYLTRSKSFQKVSDNAYAITYTGKTNTFSSVMDDLESSKSSYFEIEIDGEVDSDLNSNLLGNPGSLSLKWQKILADGNKEDTGCPLDAGRYQMVITLDAVPDVCKEQSAVIDFEIKPVELQIGNVAWDAEVAAGTTVGAYKEQIKKDYTLSYQEKLEYGGFTTKFVEKSTVVDGQNVELVVIDSYTKTALEDTALLRSDADYKVYFAKLPLVDTAATNYKVSGVGEEYLHTITVSDLTATQVVVEKVDPAKEITVVYNADKDASKTALEAAVNAAVKSKKVYVKTDDETVEKTEITLAEDEALTLEWYTPNIDNGGKITYNPLGEGVVPTDAGEYYAYYKYAGRKGIYAESSVNEDGAIKVTIEPVSLILKPNGASKPELQAGMELGEVQEALASLEYTLHTYTVDNAGKITLDAAAHPEGENFWGVSYNDKGKTQYYKPLFVLEYREAQKDEEGNIQKVDGKVQYGNWAVFSEEDGVLRASEGQDREIEYRIVFSGYKAVFDEDGALSKTVEITDTSTMEAARNYLVRADEQTRHAYSENEGELSLVLPVDVKTAAKVEIDVTEIINGFKTINSNTKDTDGLTEESPLWKIYDGEALYTAREDYKKAGIKTADGQVRTTLNENETLSYTWEYKNYNDAWVSVWSQAIDSDLRSGLSSARLYRLTINYTDAAHANQSASKAVYFEVKQQEVIVVGEGFTARVGKAPDDLSGSYRVYKLPNNSEEEFAKLDEDARGAYLVGFFDLFPYDPRTGSAWASEADCKAYVNDRLQIQVQRQEKDDAGNPVDKYVDVAEDEEFVAGYNYRACLYFDRFGSSNYTNIDTAATTEEETFYHAYWFDLGLQNIGTEKLAVIVDKSKLPSSKTYDGEPIFIEDAFNNGLLKVVLANDHSKVVEGLSIGSVEEYFASLDDPTIEKKDVYYGFARLKEDGTRDASYGYSWYALDAGTYYVGAWFAGNEQYADFDFVFSGIELENGDTLDECSFEIKKQPITIRPVLTETTVAAGEYVFNLYDDATPFEVVKGKIADIDSQIFEYGSWIDSDGERQSGYPAFNGTLHASYQYEGEQAWGSDFLRYGKTYEVSVNSNNFHPICTRDYEITFEKATYTVAQRGNAQVTAGSFGSIGSVRLSNTIEQGVGQTIVPVEGIPFYYNYNFDGKQKDGNFFALQIEAPKEYTNSSYHSEYGDNYTDFVYENDIRNNGGYLTNKFNESNRYITVVFDVTDMKDLDAEDPGRKKEFSICWEDGYVEKFVLDFSNAVLEDNLREAVAPKSLAFNGISNKMVVGEEQNLDVKITKVQLGDIISIAYEVNDTDVLSIDEESGHVTALQAGKSATVTAYAYRLDKDGNKERLGKPATAKIAVTDVTAPAIKKIDELRNGGATIHFTPVTNGYRRELYVLEGKVKEDAFKSEIEKLEQGRSNNLVKVVYDLESSSSSKAEYDKKGKLVTYKYVLAGLDKELEQDYTVYIRNVSAVRTLADGSSVKLSAKGAVKNFKTTKPQVTELLLYSEDDAATEYLNNSVYIYRVALDSKKVQLTTGGIYKDYGKSADSNDVITWVLPTKEKSVVNPKLTYEVHDYDSAGYVLDEVASKYAAVSNKGLLTLKGTGLNGYARVQVKVTADNGVYDTCDVIITAEPDAVKAKNVKVKVGDPIVIPNYLDYTQGKTKVLNYISSRLEIVNREELEENGITITRPYIDNSGYQTYCLTATKDGKFDVHVRDLSLKAHQDNEEAYVTVKLSVSKLDAVKSLKTAYVDDSRITINFAHAGTPSDFLIVVEDGRGSLVSRKLVPVSDRDYVSAIDPDYQQEGQRHVVDKLTYFAKTKTYAYTINKDLVRQSAYKISVTAMYESTEAKAATTKTKTTNIPASKVNMAAVSYAYGGARIYVTNESKSISGYGNEIKYNPYLSSGNTYTLNLDADPAAKTRITDTLTWKSSDTKVATVKANAGTYTATLKALKQGVTTIEVTSKITKKVIARYQIVVTPVNNAGTYYGDYESGGSMPEWFRLNDPIYNGPIEVLTLSNDVKVQLLNATRNYTWVVFTAPAFGEYTFESDKTLYIYDESYNQIDNSSNGMLLESGQKIYFKVYGSFVLSATGKEFGEFTTVGSSVAVAPGTWVSFVAPEDNYYTFTGVNQTIRVVDNSALTSEYLETVYDDTDNLIGYGRGMKAGESILLQADSTGTITIVKRNIDANAVLTVGTAAKDELTNAENEKWFKFVAPATAEYTFTITGADVVGYYKNINEKNPEIWAYPTLVDTTTADTLAAMAKAVEGEEGGAETEITPPKTYSNKISLNEGDVVMLKLALDGELPEGETKREVTINISKPDISSLNVGSNEVTLETSDEAWRSFEVGEGYYKFEVTGKDGGYPDVTYYDNNMEELYMYNGKLTVSSDSDVKPGDKIYLKISNVNAATVTITKVEVKAELKAGIAEKVELIGKGSSSLEYWYTFTAPHDGDYTFRFETDKMKEGYSTERAGNYLSLGQYSKVFGEFKENFDIWNNTKTVKLSTGETLTFCLTVDEIVDENFKWLGYIFVDDVDGGTGVTAVKAGENPIDVKDAKDITNWYAFKADIKGEYNFAWAKAETSGDVEIGLYDDMASGVYSDVTDSGTSKYMNAGDVIYIKVVQKTATAVSGKLNITVPADATPEKVKDGTLTFNELANGTTKYYTFTASQTTNYAIITTTADNATADVTFDGGRVNAYAERDLVKGKTYRISVTATSDKSSGTVTIKPIVPESIAADGDITAKKDGTPSWYVWTVPVAGRYNLIYDTNDKMDIECDFEGDAMGSYFEAGDSVLIKATSLDNTADQKTKFTPAITMKALELKTAEAAGQEITITRGTTDYYKYTVAEDGVYVFTTSVPETDGVAASSIQYVLNTDNNYRRMYSSNDINLEKGDIIYVRMAAPDDTDANFVFKMEKRKETELIAGKPSDEITLGDGEEAWFSFDVKAEGEFAFKTQDVTPDASLSYANVSTTVSNSANGFYFVCKVEKFNTKITFSVINNSGKEVKFKVLAERVVYEELTEAKALENVGVAKGELKWLKFTAPEDGRYTFASSNADVTLYGYTRSLSEEMAIEKDETLTMYLINNGSDASATTNVSVVSVKPEEITDAPITVPAGDSKWVKYTAKKDGKYAFTVKDGADSEVSVNAYDSIIAASGTAYASKILAVDDVLYFRLPTSVEEKTYTFTVDVTYAKIYDFTFEKYSDIQEVTFTAPQTGTYKITGSVPSDGKSDFYVYTNGNRVNVYGANNNVTLFEGELTTGEKIDIRIQPYYSYTGKYGGSIRIVAEQIVE